MWGATCTATSALVGSAAERHAERHAGCHAERHSERLSELHPPLPHSSGGGTRFNMLGIQVIPRKGTALIFFPTFTDGTIDTNSLHEALPAEERKFVCQVWIRERELPDDHAEEKNAMGHRLLAALHEPG